METWSTGVDGMGLAGDVEAYIEQGLQIPAPRPPCPLCAGPTRGWSGYWRHLRIEKDELIWIARVGCAACGVTQSLLPWFVMPWRWDVVRRDRTGAGDER